MRGCGMGGLVSLFLLMVVSAPVYSQGSRDATNLRASFSGNDVLLEWDAPASDAASVNWYKVTWEASSDGVAFPHTATVAVLDGSTGLRFDLSARGEKRYYTFRAQALRGSSASGWTNTVFIDAETSTVITAPAAPDSLRAAPGDEEVGLAWEDPLDGAILGYEISYSDDAGLVQDWTDIDDSDAGTTRHTVSMLMNGTEYTFEVRALNAAGPGDPASVTATPTPPPGAPVNLGVSAGDASVTLTWDAPYDVFISGYQLRYGESDALLPSWVEMPDSDAAHGDGIDQPTQVYVGGARVQRRGRGGFVEGARPAGVAAGAGGAQRDRECRDGEPCVGGCGGRRHHGLRDDV